MEINFRLVKPNGVPVVADNRRPDNTHRHTVREAGDYQICFDNTISRFSPKVIFFELLVEKEGDDDDEDDGEIKQIFTGVAEEQYDMKVTTFSLLPKFIVFLMDSSDYDLFCVKCRAKKSKMCF